MSVRAFQPSPPIDLTLPGGASETVRAVMSMALRKLFEDLKALSRPAGLSPRAARDWQAFRKVLVSFLPGRPGAVASLLRAPAVATPLRCLRDGAAPPDAMVAEVVGQALFELHLAGALASPFELSRGPEVLASSRHGAHVPAGAPVRFEPGSLRVGGALAELRRGGFVSLDRDLHLVLEDTNPLRMQEAHPDKDGNRVQLGDRPTQEWTDTLRRALAMVERHLPGVRRSIDLLIRHVVPVGFDAERHLSASYREALGVVYVSLHPSVLTMAEALVHETGHNVLNAMMELDPLLTNSPDETVVSPWRPDPRPLLGVLLAVHAFLPVEAMLRRMREAGEELVPAAELDRRLERVRTMNADGVRVLLEHARPTEVGQGVLDEMRRLDEAMASA